MCGLLATSVAFRSAKDVLHRTQLALRTRCILRAHHFTRSCVNLFLAPASSVFPGLLISYLWKGSSMSPTLLDRSRGKGTLGEELAQPPASEQPAHDRERPADRTALHRGRFERPRRSRPDPGYPGQYPFTRGVHATMYRGRLWTMRQFAGFGTPRQTNERFKFLLEKGQTGLSTAFDLPTLMGLDSDNPRSSGEVGRLGVAVDTLDDMLVLFDGINLEKISVSMTINAPAIVIMAFYLAAAQERGFDWRRLRGTIQNDILKEFHAQNEFVFPPEPSVRLVCDVIEFCARHVPQWNPVSISGYHIREAGSTAAQELAFTLADGFHYVEQCLARGMAVDDFAPRLSFFFNSHNDLFEEVAKYRAARVLWAEAMRNRYGATDEASWKLRFHAQTAGCSLQDKQPELNLIRVAYQALAAVLGGCQSLHTNSMDETLALPSEHAVTLALRTQQVLAYETGVTNTVDPLGGSYFVEALTRAMQHDALAYLRPHRIRRRHDRRHRSRLFPPRDRRRRVCLSTRSGREAEADRRLECVRRAG